MKKIVLMMTALLAISLSACSQKKTETSMEQKVLVAYFSASGTTKDVAQQLAEVAGADLHEIKLEKPYTDADLNWNDKQSRSSVEMQDKNSRPAITAKLQNMQDYDMVYVGFPIWWYTCPTIVNMYNGGHAIDDIWAVNGFKSRSSIFRILKKYGITLNRGPHSGPIKKWSERKNPIIKDDKQ